MQLSPPLPLGSVQADQRTVPEPARRAPAGKTIRRQLLVCGDPRNLGDLALIAQNLAVARRLGQSATLRTWGPLPAPIAAQIGRWGGALVDGKSTFALIGSARGADMVIGGGEMIRANASVRALVLLRLAAAVVAVTGGSITTRGLGVGKVSGLRAWLWRGILRRATRLAVRDTRSAENLRPLVPGRDPFVAADMALMGDGLARLTRAAAPAGLAGAVIVAPCIDASEGRTLDAATLRAACLAARARLPAAPLVLACHDERPGMDRAAADGLRASLAEAGLDVTVFSPGGDLAALLALYRDAALVITNRLHAGIFAALHHRPLLVLDDGNPKLGILTDALGCATLNLGPNTGRPLAERLSDVPLRRVSAALDFDRGRRAAALTQLQADSARNLPERDIAIFAVKYSPNLGDGIIAECLEGELRRAVPGLRPRSLDLAGRIRFSAGHGSHRRTLLSLLEKLPTRVRHRLVPAMLGLLLRVRHENRWRRELRDCGGVVIGGGALFADVDQNFPLKLAQAFDRAREHDLPVAVASVGVTADWSEEGLARVTTRMAAARLVSASVRDHDSVTRWEHLFGAAGLPRPRFAPDPGLLAAAHYGRVDRQRFEDAAPRVGLCITSPLALRLHGESAHDDAHLAAWNLHLVHELAASGCRVVLFTNGSPEDRAFRDELVGRIEDAAMIEVAADFADPAALVRCIAGLDCLLAHRLHACIVAYSYRIPAIGLAWDRKLDAFFEQTGRGQFMLDTRESSPMAAATLALEAIETPPDAEMHAALVSLSRAEIHRLGRCLIAAGTTADTGADAAANTDASPAPVQQEPCA